MAVQLNSQKGAEPVTTEEVQQCSHNEVFRTERGKKKQPSLFKEQELRVVCNLT